MFYETEKKKPTVPSMLHNTASRYKTGGDIKLIFNLFGIKSIKPIYSYNINMS